METDSTRRERTSTSGLARYFWRAFARTGSNGVGMKRALYIFLALAGCALSIAAAAKSARAQTDCLACHADASLQDEAGHSLTVDGKSFASSVHGSLKCGDCHAGFKDYPHPDKATPVKCATCHAGQAEELAGSV